MRLLLNKWSVWFLGMICLLAMPFKSFAENFGEAVPPSTLAWRGVNIGIEYDLPEELFDELESNGVTCIRLVFKCDSGDPLVNPPTAEDPLAPYRFYMGKLDQILEWCEVRHIGVVCAPSGLWGRSPLDIFWQDEGSQKYRDHIVKFWEKFASRLAVPRRPALVAVEVLNEPSWNTEESRKIWMDQILPDSVAAIRNAGLKLPIIVEPGSWGQPNGFEQMAPLSDTNIIYSFHIYGPHHFTHQGINRYKDLRGKIAYPGVAKDLPASPELMWDKQQLIAYCKPALDFSKKYGVPMYIGEFGAARWAPGAEAYVRDCISICEENGWGWAFHSYAALQRDGAWDPQLRPEVTDIDSVRKESRINNTPLMHALRAGWVGQIK